VITGPGNERAAPAGRMRASHADREQVIGTLKTAFVQGRLAKDEFDVRVGQALAARTHAQLTAVTADIPVDLTGDRPVRAPTQPALGVKSGICVTMTAALLAAVLWAAAVVAGSAAALAAALAVSGVVILTLFVTCDQMRELQRRKRSAGPLPPGGCRRRAVPGSG
jgi:uncharacterized protein DUF1707